MGKVLTKHSDAIDSYASDFADQLPDGESLQAPLTFVVTKGAGSNLDAELGRFVPVGPWTVVTSQFVSAGPTLTGTQVSATLKKRAASGEQAAGLMYVVEVTVTTNTGRTLVDSWYLDITEEAVP